MVQFWTLEAIILQHTCLERMYVLFNNRSDLDDAILGVNDYSSGRYCCSRRVLIARRWKQFFDHIIHPSRIDCRRVSRRNLPWGQPFTLLWTRHRGGVLNAGRLLLRKTLPSRSSQNVHQRKYLCEGIHVQSSILYLLEGQNSGCQMSGIVIHIYKERLLIHMVCTIIYYNRVSIPLKRFRIQVVRRWIGLHLRNTRNIVLNFSDLVDCYWVARDWFNRHRLCECSCCFVTFTYIKKSPHSWVYNQHWMCQIVSRASKEQLCRRSLLGLLYFYQFSCHLLSGRRSTVGDCRWEQTCFDSLSQFRFNL